MVWPTLGSRMAKEWVSSFLAAQQHIIGHFSAMTAKEQNRTEATESFTPCSNKNGDTKLNAVPLLSNLNRFLKFLNRLILQEICNKAITKDIITPCIHCHTTRRRATGFEFQRLCDKHNVQIAHVTLTTPLSGNIFHRQGGICYRKSMYKIWSL